jgi:hypothetical protein
VDWVEITGRVRLKGRAGGRPGTGLQGLAAFSPDKPLVFDADGRRL